MNQCEIWGDDSSWEMPGHLLSVLSGTEVLLLVAGSLGLRLVQEGV